MKTFNAFAHLCLMCSIIAWAETPVTQPSKVQGKVLGFGQLKNDDVIDGAFILPSLRAYDLITFQLDHLLAPSEVMKVGPTSAKVPGNLYFPKQRESYGILPLTIEKDPFSFHPKAGVTEELSALWFSAPFNKVADLARSKAPYYDIVPLVKLKGFSLTVDQSWAQTPTTILNLNKTYSKKIAYTWGARQASPKDFDVIVAFQRTPASRWIVTDFIGKAPLNGNLNSGEKLLDDHKLLFMRVYNNEKNKPFAAGGFIRNAEMGQHVDISGVAEKIVAPAINNTLITWEPIQKHGLMAVLSGVDSLININEEGPFDVFGHFGFRNLWSTKVTKVQWVSGNTGSFDMGVIDPKSSVTLVFVSTDRPVNLPTTTQEEPEVFTYATELAMHKLK